ncbi:MAG TPA: dTMP kinase [Candidatus Saccharimonadales bacterium]|nr:dTMP kinase [Candidatus Saccharimonadales bacterium]
MKRGKYIVIEGLDGSGKSTQQQRLLHTLGDQAIGVREPGGTPMAEAIRTLIKDGSIPRAPRTNVFLFSAARAELTDTIIRPAIGAGKHVVADRNWLSTVAYQSAEGVSNMDEIYQLCKAATEELFTPDLLIFIDTPVKICWQRLQKRGSTQGDYFDELGENYFARVREVYLEHLQKLPRYEIVDGSGSIEEIAAKLHTLATALLS